MEKLRNGNENAKNGDEDEASVKFNVQLSRF